MIERLDAGKGILKIVGQHELELHTRCGWKLIAILESVSSHPTRESTYSTNGAQVITYGPNSELMIHQFAVMLDEESSLAKISAECDALSKSASDAHAECKKALAAAKFAKDAEISYKDSYERAQKAAEDNKKLYSSSIAAASKLENDLAKLRQAIGDIRYYEILGQSGSGITNMTRSTLALEASNVLLSTEEANGDRKFSFEDESARVLDLVLGSTSDRK
jgi:hypothetical protein